MSEKINTELNQRVNSAYIAKDFTLLNGGTDNIIMVKGERNGETADLLFTYEGISEVLKDLEPDTLKKEEATTENTSSNEI